MSLKATQSARSNLRPPPLATAWSHGAPASPHDFLHSLANHPHMAGEGPGHLRPVTDFACPTPCGQSPDDGTALSPICSGQQPPEQQGFNPVDSTLNGSPPPLEKVHTRKLNTEGRALCPIQMALVLTRRGGGREELGTPDLSYQLGPCSQVGLRAAFCTCPLVLSPFPQDE